MGGKPCIRGLRITVDDVLDYLASGMSEAEILADFPDLTQEDIRACLAFAADRERRLAGIPAGSSSSTRFCLQRCAAIWQNGSESWFTSGMLDFGSRMTRLSGYSRHGTDSPS
jgi:uncharacterized protein (DUF433 family)